MPLPAFPGAQGEGSETTHARDPAAVSLFVTNLDDDGPDAVAFGNCCRRRALLYPGPAYIHYRVSGRINCTSKAVKYNFPNKYDAFQTSPGGVCVSGEENQLNTHDVLVRFGRFFVGDEDVPQVGFDNRDAFNTGDPADLNGVHDAIWDHCEFRYAVDENMTRWWFTERTTLQNCIVAEGLLRSKHPKGQHSMGTLWGIAARYVTTHRSILWACNQRMPQSAGALDKAFYPVPVPIPNHFDFRNNFVGDWGEEPFAIEHLGNTGNIYRNHFEIGPDFNRSLKQAVRIGPDANDMRLYIEENITPLNPTGAGDNWNDVTLDNGTSPPTVPNRLLVADPMATVTTMPTSAVRNYVLANAGATKPFSDSARLRTLKQIRARCRNPNTRYFIDSQADLVGPQTDSGGWPIYPNLPVPFDSNNDGIPDAFCVANGLGVFDNIMNVDSGTGYSWMERYLSELAGD